MQACIFFLPPQRGRDLNSKTINQTAALPIRLHAPAHFAAGVSKGGESGRDRPKERGGPFLFFSFFPFFSSFFFLLAFFF
jgi:hypothetical protein